MKKALLFLLLLVIALSLFATGNKEKGERVVVYSYDSFSGDWGPWPNLKKAFEEKTGYTVDLVEVGSGTELVTRIKEDGNRSDADVVIGIPDDLALDVIEYFDSYIPKGITKINPNALFDDTNRLIPFDWGAFAFIIDIDSSITPPTSLSDLTKSEYKDKVILIDPRGSSVGNGLLNWTINYFTEMEKVKEFGEGAQLSKEDEARLQALGEDKAIAWWKEMEKNALTMPSSWSQAYGLFTEGEAPIMISYTTSPIYDIINEGKETSVALIFEGEDLEGVKGFHGGHQATIESMGIPKSARNRKGAEAFIDFMLTEEAQKITAEGNSMYPVIKGVELDGAYSAAPIPKHDFTSSFTETNERERIIERWRAAVTDR